MENEWIEIDEERSNLPEVEGNYFVRFHTGSIAPKIVERIARFHTSTSRPRFSGEFDWDFATHWKNI